MPDEIADYARRRASCEHWAGEEPYDAKRRAFLKQHIREDCTGLSVQYRWLHDERFAGDAKALAQLATIAPDTPTPPAHQTPATYRRCSTITS